MCNTYTGRKTLQKHTGIWQKFLKLVCSNILENHKCLGLKKLFDLKGTGFHGACSQGCMEVFLHFSGFG